MPFLYRLSPRAFSVRAWGNADLGQLGLPSALLQDEAQTFGRTAPQPHPIPSLQQIKLRTACASSAHSAFVTQDGSLLTCGYGTDGQLGHGDFQSVHTPHPVHNLPHIRSVACGNRHTLALTFDGRVFSFGCNRFGQLGLAHLSSPPRKTNLPHPVNFLSDIGSPISSIAAGDDFSTAVDERGRLYTWGSGENGRLAHPDLAVKPSPISFLLARTRDAQHAPRLVRSLKHANVQQVYCGKHLATAVCSGGASYSWGSGKHFQLNNAKADDEFEPVLSNRQFKVRKVAHGAMHTLMLTDSGTVFVLGQNERGSLGIGRGSSSIVVSEPLRIPSLSNVTDIAAGWRISAAVVGGDLQGRVYMWGCGEAGALGTGEDIDHWEPLDIGLQARRVVIGCDGTSVLALS